MAAVHHLRRPPCTTGNGTNAPSSAERVHHGAGIIAPWPAECLHHQAGVRTLTGNLILTVMLAFAEYERGTIVERTQTGKAVARQDPNFRDGRPKKFTPEQINLALSLLAQGKTYRQITTMTGISKSTLIRAKKRVIN